MAHHPLGPSGRHRYQLCPGSVAAEAPYPRSDSAASAEGTLAHEAAESILLGKVEPAMPDGMAEHVESYVDYVRSLVGPDDTLLVEHKVDLGEWIPGCSGTADAVVISGDVLHVVDLKFGKGVAVDVHENPQLEAYGLGAWREFEWLNPSQVVLHIVQPRLGVFESWAFPATEVEERGARLRLDAERALAPDAPRIPGEKQCRFCLHRTHCKELAEHAFETVSGMFKPLEDVVAEPLAVRSVDRLEDDELSAVLPKLDLIERWCSSVRSRAYDVASSRGLPGWKLVAGRSSRRWADESKAREAFVAAGRDPEEFTEVQMLSVAQLERVWGKKDPLMLEHVVKQQGRPALVVESDKREAIAIEHVGFGVIEANQED
jgi:hypothetical protein